MPIKAYIGIPRQGKTYEVVTGTIYGSLCKGRRVVSNIAGLNRDAMLAAFVATGGFAKNFGELVIVTHEQVREPNFWLCEGDRENGINTIIQAGDVVALDEVWRFWNGLGLRDDDGKRPDRVMKFFRMHGHFTHPETGLCCEVAFITQDIGDFHRSTRAVIDETYMMTKLTAIGSSTRYRVDIFQKSRITRRPLRQLQRTYNPDFFCFYKSHSQHVEGDAEPLEESPDQRGNILKGAIFRYVLPVGLVVFILAVWYIYGFFHPKPKDLPIVVSGSQQKAQGISSKPPSPEISSDWRVVGYYKTAAGLSVALHNGEHVRVLHNPPGYKVSALSVEVILPDGQVVTDWTGAKNEGGVLPHVQ